MKTMGNCKCAHFNEFVSDALSQENNNAVYAASKSRKRAYEAGASQSKAPVTQRAPFRPPASAAKFRPLWGIYPRVPQDGTWAAPSEVARPVRSRRAHQDYKLY